MTVADIDVEQLRNRPYCPASGKDRWGESTYCGKPVARLHGNEMRCMKHSTKDDPKIKPSRLIKYDADARLSAARYAAQQAKARRESLEAGRARAVESFEKPVLVETTDFTKERAWDFARTIEVRYNARGYDGKPLPKAVTAAVRTYGRGSTRLPEIKVKPEVPWSGDSGPWMTALAMAWQWVAEIMDSATGDAAAAFLPAIDKAVTEEETTAASLVRVEAEIAALKEQLK
ncbi:MAG: hypothetical protein ACOYB2_11105 [Limnohabitans sp.]